jgi:hypothetical protein
MNHELSTFKSKNVKNLTFKNKNKNFQPPKTKPFNLQKQEHKLSTSKNRNLLDFEQNIQMSQH